MLDGELLSLLRGEVVRAVCIHGEDERGARRLLRRELCRHARQHLLRLLRPKRAVNEIILHIHNNECLAHDNCLRFQPNQLLFVLIIP